MRSLFSTSVPAVFFCFPWWNDHWLRQVNHACGGGLKYLGANSGVDGVSSCVLSKLGLFFLFLEGMSKARHVEREIRLMVQKSG